MKVPITYAVFLIALLLGGGCRPSVHMEADPERKETNFSIQAGSCLIKWTAPSAERFEGVIRHTSQCSLPLAAQVPLLSQLLGTVSKLPEYKSFHTLYWGNLEDTPDLSMRLALAAHRSPEWDEKKGRPKSQQLYGFIVKLANQEQIHSELIHAFREHDRSVKVSHLEKVRVLPAAELPFCHQLEREGVKPTDRLPFDCMLWFSIARERS